MRFKGTRVCFFDDTYQFIMRNQMPDALDRKAHVQVLPYMPPLDHRPPHVTHLQDTAVVFVDGEEIRALPVVGQSDTVEAVISEQRR